VPEEKDVKTGSEEQGGSDDNSTVDPVIEPESVEEAEKRLVVPKKPKDVTQSKPEPEPKKKRFWHILRNR
jgi:hypothetical protein